ncbi:DUF768 domain-containing protein [Mesorhizobium caraganae]|uniref:DUF768 domain-containing protein n=1 Tax=Mesorhizobium caraganae TaxID=483206 RepID=UPI0019399061|nr:DUF768 domain-containing protein [Mesorhizobium caraganae]MBM2712712.1 DUF768 domain-containing protein [Mesorhizobium caraganae]
MSKRGSDFLYHRISDRLPDNPIVDPVLLVIDIGSGRDGRRKPKAFRGRIDEEIGLIFEAIMQGLR